MALATASTEGVSPLPDVKRVGVPKITRFAFLSPHLKQLRCLGGNNMLVFCVTIT